VISRFGAGTSNVDISAAEARGIKVLNAPGANAQGVAELALALTLNCLRSITASSEALRDGRWERRQGREVAGLSVLVLGFGAIGQRYATAMVALGAKVTAIDPIAPAHPAVVVVRDIADMIGAADVISLHCPPAPDGSAFVDAALLSRARRGVIVVNTARAELVEDKALLAALDDGRVGSYAVDAFRIEPPAPTELLRHPRVTATPHIGAFTAESAERTLLASVDNLVRALGR
jgi:phosphoglycerate dehydrogenase-like enzyme